MERLLHNNENKWKLSLFKDKDEMGTHINFWINELGIYGTSIERTLRVIGTSCQNIPGVGWSRKNTYADKEHLNCSKRTVQRHIKFLEENGVIKQYPTVDSKGQQMQNIIQIQRYSSEEEIAKREEEKVAQKEVIKGSSETVVSPSVSPRLSPHTYIFLSDIFYSLNLLNVKKDETSKAEADKTITYPSYIPESFVKHMSIRFGKDAEMVHKLWGKVKMAVRKANFTLDIEEHMDVIVKMFDEAKSLGIHLKGLRKGDSMDAVIGYWFSALRKYFIKQQEENDNFWTPISELPAVDQTKAEAVTPVRNQKDGFVTYLEKLQQTSMDNYNSFKRLVLETAKQVKLNTYGYSINEVLYALKDASVDTFTELKYKLFRLCNQEQVFNTDLPY